MCVCGVCLRACVRVCLRVCTRTRTYETKRKGAREKKVKRARVCVYENE